MKNCQQAEWLENKASRGIHCHGLRPSSQHSFFWVLLCICLYGTLSITSAQAPGQQACRSLVVPTTPTISVTTELEPDECYSIPSSASGTVPQLVYTKNTTLRSRSSSPNDPPPTLNLGFTLFVLTAGNGAILATM